MTTTRVTDKELALRIIQDQPADSSAEELIEALLLHRMIERGLADADAGRTLSLEELRQRKRAWRK